jgi:hypothetical protein
MAGLLGLAAALPATWLQWEGATAQSQAALVANAEAAQASAGLRGLFAGFERATAALHATDLTGDPVALTGKLLRLEPLIAPASSLAVVNPAGVQLAATSVAIDPANKPLWWTSSTADLPQHDAGLLGCGGTTPYVAGFVLARRVTDDAGAAAGAVAGRLAASDLLNLVRPADATLPFQLRDATGCVLLHGNEAAAAPAAGDTGPALIRLYRHMLPQGWGMPAATVATARIGNLVWSGTVSPEAALALRQAAIDEHGATVQRAVAGLLGLAALLPLMLFASVRRRRGEASVPAEILPLIVQAAPPPLALEEPEPALHLIEPTPEHRMALVVGFTGLERQRVAAQLEFAGMEAETAEDGFLALSLAERADYMHGGLDLMVLDGAFTGFSVQDLLAQLKARTDLDRLRIVLVANGRFAGAFGGPGAAAADNDRLVTDIFATRPAAETREAVLVAGE